MFTPENSTGFSAADFDLLNAAVVVLVTRGVAESNATDIVNNNWQPDGNTVESLSGVKLTRLAWNGCDCYVRVDETRAPDHVYDGEYLYHGAQRFAAFDAVEVDPDSLPLDDGEPDYSDVCGTDDGRFYRPVE